MLRMFYNLRSYIPQTSGHRPCCPKIQEEEKLITPYSFKIWKWLSSNMTAHKSISILVPDSSTVWLWSWPQHRRMLTHRKSPSGAGHRAASCLLCHHTLSLCLQGVCESWLTLCNVCVSLRQQPVSVYLAVNAGAASVWAFVIICIQTGHQPHAAWEGLFKLVLPCCVHMQSLLDCLTHTHRSQTQESVAHGQRDFATKQRETFVGLRLWSKKKKVWVTLSTTQNYLENRSFFFLNMKVKMLWGCFS